MNYLAKFKTATHFISAGVIAGATWVALHPEIVAKFPKASVITAAAGLVLALYHSPLAK